MSDRQWTRITARPSSTNPQPEEWGHRYWYTANTDALAIDRALVPDSGEDVATVRDAVRAGILRFEHTMPCARCRAHFAQDIAVYPITDAVLATTGTMQAWLAALGQRIKNREEQEEKEDKETEAAAAAAAAAISPKAPAGATNETLGDASSVTATKASGAQTAETTSPRSAAAAAPAPAPVTTTTTTTTGGATTAAKTIPTRTQPRSISRSQDSVAARSAGSGGGARKVSSSTRASTTTTTTKTTTTTTTTGATTRSVRPSGAKQLEEMRKQIDAVPRRGCNCGGSRRKNT